MVWKLVTIFSLQMLTFYGPTDDICAPEIQWYCMSYEISDMSSICDHE